MDLFATRFGVRSAFVRVGALSRILGIGSTTIYSAMRSGSFFLPHRMLGAAPVVKLEDLAEWYCRASERPARAAACQCAAALEAIERGPSKAPQCAREAPAQLPAEKKARRQAIIEQAMALLAVKRQAAEAAKPSRA
ncbi:hypothetical protein [Caballeronia sp. GAFFF2]|uniref:hypothetical protein n=1 Tax=Caballeronia sp. GAFFF2 TaxID=2921741 RepID=UPI002027FCBE|nr:hypothetical protein [Caballeronia sp. GAFFF2]